MTTRSSDQIRTSIESNRRELGSSLVRLRQEVVEVADWRGQIRRHQREVAIGAAAVGFVFGGGLVALGGLVFGRRGRSREYG